MAKCRVGVVVGGHCSHTVEGFALVFPRLSATIVDVEADADGQGVGRGHHTLTTSVSIRLMTGATVACDYQGAACFLSKVRMF